MNEEPIRILCVFSTLDRGGAESMCMNLYRNIDRSKVQFDFVKHTHDKGAFEDEISSLGGVIYEAPRYKIYNYFQYRNWWFKHLKSHSEHQIIHGHYFTISGIYFRFAREFERITIGHCHSAKPSKITFKSIIEAHFVKIVEKLSTYCFACSEESGKWLYPHRKFKVINNAIDAQKYIFSDTKRQKIRKELGLKDEFVVGHVGNIAPVKNHSFLLDVFKEIHDSKPNSKLVLVGNGSQDELKQKAKNLGIYDDVIFTGARSDVADVLQAFDVFVFPSVSEGLGIVAVEAQAAGLHTICSDRIPGEVKLTDLVEFISLDKSATEWADAILKYDNKYERKDTSEQIKAAGYDIHTTAKQLQRFYLKISERSK